MEYKRGMDDPTMSDRKKSYTWSIENILYQDKSSQNILQTKTILKFHSLKRTT